MNKQAIEHIIDSSEAYPLSPLSFLVRLRVAKEDVLEEPLVIYGDKYLFPNKRKKETLVRKYVDESYAYYEATLRLDTPRLAYVFHFGEGGKEYYFSEQGVTETYDFATSYFNFFQYSFINESDIVRVPEWTKNAIFYEIFVDRFATSSSHEGLSDLRVNMKPSPKSHGGGDLRGIISKLDYLSGLGVNAIYLTPIFLSDTNHKYDTIDYYKIDPSFGTDRDLHDLVSALHSKGMHLVLDAVFNHCSDKNEKFLDVKEKGKASPFFNHFIIHDDHVDTAKPNYEMFASCSYMPKINTNSEGARHDLIAVGLYYIEKFDIDGWRLDVSDEVSHLFWREFRTAIKSKKEDAIIIGENWHVSTPYLRGDEFDSVMNYPFLKAALDYFGPGKLSSLQMSERLNGLLVRYSEPTNSMMLNLIDSHDTPRFFTSVDGNKSRLLCAFALMMAYLGMPCLYYGDEIPLPGMGDPDNRRLFPWGEPLDEEYRSRLLRIISWRKYKPLQRGSISITSDNGALLISRDYEEEHFLAIFNGEDGKRYYEERGAVIDSWGYENGIIEPNGYALIRRKRI